MIFLPDESKRTIIPRQIEQIRTENSPNSLTEYCLRGLYQNQFYYDAICANLSADGLPKKILQYVLDGPVAMCGLGECDKPLFTECHFSLMKKYDDLSCIDHLATFHCHPITHCLYFHMYFVFIELSSFDFSYRNQSPSHIIFSNMFCSKICLNKWHENSKRKYHPIQWVTHLNAY